MKSGVTHYGKYIKTMWRHAQYLKNSIPQHSKVTTDQARASEKKSKTEYEFSETEESWVLTLCKKSL